MKVKLSLITKLYGISAICFLVSMITLVLSFKSTEAISIQEKLKKAKLQYQESNNVSVNHGGKIFIYPL